MSMVPVPGDACWPREQPEGIEATGCDRQHQLRLGRRGEMKLGIWEAWWRSR